MKKCSKCKKDKSSSEFFKDATAPTGLAYRCKACCRTNDRGIRLQALYGMSTRQYEAALRTQSGKCAICLTKPKSKRRLAVDHCHKTGKIRGLLCTPCNLSLGGFKDSVCILRFAIKYLTKHRS